MLAFETRMGQSQTANTSRSDITEFFKFFTDISKTGKFKQKTFHFVKVDVNANPLMYHTLHFDR